MDDIARTIAADLATLNNGSGEHEFTVGLSETSDKMREFKNELGAIAYFDFDGPSGPRNAKFTKFKKIDEVRSLDRQHALSNMVCRRSHLHSISLSPNRAMSMRHSLKNSIAQGTEAAT